MAKLTVTKIPHLDTIVLKQSEGQSFFIATSDTVILSIPTLSFILKFLVDNKYMSEKVLEGILEEINTDRNSV